MEFAKASKEAHKIKINDSVTKFVHNDGKNLLKYFPVLLYGLLINHPINSTHINLSLEIKGRYRFITQPTSTAGFTPQHRSQHDRIHFLYAISAYIYAAVH